MASNVIATLHNDDADRCVKIIKQPDGTFGFKEFRRETRRRGRLDARQRANPRGTYATEAQALAAARADLAWLRDQQTGRHESATTSLLIASR